MDTKRRTLTLSAAVSVMVGAAAIGGVKRHHVKAPVQCGIPPRDYQPALLPYDSVPVVAVSSGAREVRVIATEPSTGAMVVPERKLRVRVYQFPLTDLASGHCSVSQLTLSLREDGQWIASLRADQNPRPIEMTESSPPVQASPLAAIPQTSHIRRNLFRVSFSCLGVFPNSEPTAVKLDAVGNLPLGHPVYDVIQPAAFWVQSGQPRTMRWSAVSDDVRQYFDLIDKVAIEFSYRLESPGARP